MSNTPQPPETTLLHMSLLSWKNGDITMIELKKLINTLMISRKAVEEALTGREIDVEATRKHMESKGATEDEILSMEIEADDLKDVLNDIRAALGMDNVKS